MSKARRRRRERGDPRYDVPWWAQPTEWLGAMSLPPLVIVNPRPHPAATDGRTRPCDDAPSPPR